MKNLIALLTLLSLWGCGPEQSAADRDQQQIDAQYLSDKALYTPFEGTYTGIVSFPAGGPKEVSLSLVHTDILTSTPTNLTATKYPTLNGSLSYCDGENCFATDPNSSTLVDQGIKISLCNFNKSSNILTCTAAKVTTACNGGQSPDCASQTIDLQWTSATHQGLTGTIRIPNTQDAPINVVKRL